jgi:hypothetical protein
LLGRDAHKSFRKNSDSPNRSNYGLPMDMNLTEDMILKHWELEKQLTKQLLESTVDNRWEVFERCYTNLYSKLEWLNNYIDKDKEYLPEILYKEWVYLIGIPSKKFMKLVPVEAK